MADLQLLDCFQPELVCLERVRYFPRQLLTPDDMTTDSDYFRQKLRRHNRYLHGWGVVCGLEVIARPISGTPWRVQIGPGYALGPYGDEIYVAEPVYLDLAQCGPGATTSPCEPDMLQRPEAVEGGTLYVAIKYAECVSRPVRAVPAGCACEEVECEYSRIRDSFEIGCLTEAPENPELPLLCRLRQERRIVPCLPCPTEPWIVLARVTLPPSATTNLGPQSIDNLVRRQLFMTVLLQEQVIDCCCPREEPQPEPTPVPVQVAAVNVAPGQPFLLGELTSIAIKFDKAVHPDTVNANTIQVLRSGQPVPGTVTYNSILRTATFKPISNFGVDDYMIRVRGSGSAFVKDEDELALDGNSDGTGGDDFQRKFSVNELT